MARFDLGLSDSEFWSLTQGQFLALVDRYLISRYEKNSYLSSINRILFVSNFENKNAPEVLEFPELSNVIPVERSGPDSATLIKAFEKIFPTQGKGEK